MTHVHKEKVVLILSEDRRFLSAAIGMTQTHVLSSRAFIEGLSGLAKISLDSVWSDIVADRAGVNSDSVDEPAPGDASPDPPGKPGKILPHPSAGDDFPPIRQRLFCGPALGVGARIGGLCPSLFDS
jgi:hypothetical protein